MHTLAKNVQNFEFNSKRDRKGGKEIKLWHPTDLTKSTFACPRLNIKQGHN